MKYNNIKKGIFLSRPNRFIAHIEIDGIEEICHVKNTGRCKELLVPGAEVIVQEFTNLNRKTKYDLISVYKGDQLINIDSQAPNKMFYEWVVTSEYFGKINLIKPEVKYKNSRFDFYIETENDKIFVEIKGVTLEKDGVVAFPDAPTIRGIKHLKELSECLDNGYKAYVFFVVQMNKCNLFVPNRTTHEEFADALINAEKAGVNIKCVNCNISTDEVLINDFVNIDLNENIKFK